MPRVTFLPRDIAIEAQPGDELLAVAARAGIRLAAECGGKGTCGSCLALVQQGRVDGESRRFLSPEQIEAGYVLSCLSRVADVPVTLLVTEATRALAGQFADDADAEISNDSPPLVAPPLLLPPVRRYRLGVPEPQPLDGLSDLDRLQRAWSKALREHAPEATSRPGVSSPPPLLPLPLLRGLSGALRAAHGRVTLFVHEQAGRVECCDLLPDHPDGRHYGAAIDLGTTSVAATLLDLETGRELGTRSDYNAQAEHGLDVISRIEYCRRPGGLNTLRAAVRKTLNGLLRELVRATGCTTEEIRTLSLAGNTVMTHLFLGLEPEHVRLAPYVPTLLRTPPLRAGELGLAAHPLAPLLFAPCVGSYVGGDIVSGLLCTDMDSNEALTLYIDVGTNGELVLGNRDFMLCCACSAGPAFEGAGLTCGMRAAAGAVERVAVNAGDGACLVSVLPGPDGRAVPAAGICGSGIISLLAGLFATGWLDAAGRFERERQCASIRRDGRRAAYVLQPPGGGTERELVVTEADVENILRAKAAIYAGSALLLEKAGLDFASLDRVIVAGGFGRYLDVEQAVTIGLLPDILRTRFQFIGNASRRGAALALLSEEARRRRDACATRLTYLDLSSEPEFMHQYTAALFLPHTEAERFPSVAGVRF